MAFRTSRNGFKVAARLTFKKGSYIKFKKKATKYQVCAISQNFVTLQSIYSLKKYRVSRALVAKKAEVLYY
jgi:hypothetical protein